MTKKFICVFLSLFLAAAAYTALPPAAENFSEFNFSAFGGWMCAGEPADSVYYENTWGKYSFGEDGASVICGDKGYTNISYTVNNADFDEIKGIIFSAASVTSRWDIKVRKGDGDDFSYTGSWNGTDSSEEYAFFDFSSFGWSGKDTLTVFFYSIGSEDSYSVFSYARLTDNEKIYTEGTSLPTGSPAGWNTSDGPIGSVSGSASNGSYSFSDSGITITCNENTLFYFNITKTVENVDFNEIRCLSYNVECDENSRWDIKISALGEIETFHASGGLWNGIKGPDSGHLDFSGFDKKGLCDIMVQLLVVGDASSATFSDLTFVSSEGLNNYSVNVSDTSEWDITESCAEYCGTTGDSIYIQPLTGENSFYPLSTRKFYLNLESVKGLQYIIGAKNARWLIEISNTTAGETIRINPTWAGSCGSKSGFYDFSECGWSGDANILITVSALSLDLNAGVSVKKLDFLSAVPESNEPLSYSDRDSGDVTGEGFLDIADAVSAAVKMKNGEYDLSADIDSDGSVTLNDIKSVKSLILNYSFFDNQGYSYDIPANTVIELDATGFDNYEKTLAVSLQGIVNRDGPLMFLDTGTTSYLNIFDPSEYGDAAYEDCFLEKYLTEGVEAFWKDEVKRIYGYSFLRVPLSAALEIFSDKFTSLILYDETSVGKDGKQISSVSRTNSAITAAGVYTALPVTDSLKNNFQAFQNKSTVLDLRGRFDSITDSTDWAVNNLLDKCSAEFASSYFNEGENGTFQNDYAVMNSAFCYQLAAILPENYDHVYSDQNITEIYDPQSAQLLGKILSHIDDYGFVWGWGAGGENGQASAPAVYGLELICANMANGSFYSKLPVSSDTFVQPAEETEAAAENKFYISFMMNEGDSYKAAANLYAGTWTQSARGELPISWGVDALVLDLFPFFAEYYYGEATENDSFFAASAGYGYIHPYFLPVQMQDGYAAKVKYGAEKYDLSSIDIWWFSLAGGTDKYDWLKKTGMQGLTQWTSYNSIEKTDGLPIINSQLYYPAITIWTDQTITARAELLADALREAQKSVDGKTFCTVIYGGEPQYFKEIYDNLPKDKFEAVSLDRLFEIAENCENGISVEYDFEKASAGGWDPS